MGDVGGACVPGRSEYSRAPVTDEGLLVSEESQDRGGGREGEGEDKRGRGRHAHGAPVTRSKTTEVSVL